MTINDDEAERLAHIFTKVLQQSRSVPDQTHYDHHKWITAQIDRDDAWRKFWDDMRAHVVKWGMVGALSGFFYALWLGVKAWAKQW